VGKAGSLNKKPKVTQACQPVAYDLP